jgi:anti-sigma regulatory factor (Ser/Thr protein kinase)
VLEEGDRVIFGTDGLFDTPSPSGTYFRDRVPALWQGAAELPIDQALNAMCEAAKKHGDGKILDDVLVVGLEQPPYQPEAHELLRVFPSLLDSVEQADRALESLLDGHPQWRKLAASRRSHLFLALHEAMTNAMDHGNGGDPGKRVAVACRLTAETALVRVVDEGFGFDLESCSPPGPADSDRGRGIPILRTTTHHLRMRKGELEFRFDLKGASHDTQL